LIQLGVLFPDHLNLNGDYGNIEVIAKQLEWRGMPFEIKRVESEEELASGLDFLLVGHGSTAAWEDIAAAMQMLAKPLRSLLLNQTPCLSVSTGFEALVRSSVLSELSFATMPQRVSKFVVHPDGDNEVLGYLNTDSDLPLVHRESNFLGTMLHGPVLAKNPHLLIELLLNITKSAGVSLQPIQVSEKADQLADLIDEVWKLERELASE
jgi:CobQ-like glutamine amidotransferase family enzyme